MKILQWKTMVPQWRMKTFQQEMKIHSPDSAKRETQLSLSHSALPVSLAAASLLRSLRRRRLRLSRKIPVKPSQAISQHIPGKRVVQRMACALTCKRGGQVDQTRANVE